MKEEKDLGRHTLPAVQEIIYFPVLTDEFHPDKYNELAAFQPLQMGHYLLRPPQAD